MQFKVQKCKGCGLIKQAHFRQTFFVICEYNEEYKDWEQTYKDATGNPRNIEYTCNNGSCPVYKADYP